MCVKATPSCCGPHPSVRTVDAKMNFVSVLLVLNPGANELTGPFGSLALRLWMSR